MTRLEAALKDIEFVSEVDLRSKIAFSVVKDEIACLQRRAEVNARELDDLRHCLIRARDALDDASLSVRVLEET